MGSSVGDVLTFSWCNGRARRLLLGLSKIGLKRCAGRDHGLDWCRPYVLMGVGKSCRWCGHGWSVGDDSGPVGVPGVHKGVILCVGKVQACGAGLENILVRGMKNEDCERVIGFGLWHVAIGCVQLVIGLDTIWVGVGVLLCVFPRLLRPSSFIHCVGGSAEAGPARERCDEEVWPLLAVEDFERDRSCGLILYGESALSWCSLRMFATRWTIEKESLQVGCGVELVWCRAVDCSISALFAEMLELT